MTIWIAQNEYDPTWLLAFETRPTVEDLTRACKGSFTVRSEWQVYRYHVHATVAGLRRRKRAETGEGR